jgi:hypothetical protein
MAKTARAQTFVRAVIGGRRYSRAPTDAVAPTAPTWPLVNGVEQSPIPNTTFIDVAWINGVDAETGIKETLVEYRRNGAASWTEFSRVAYPGSQETIDGLTLGTPYDIRLTNYDYAPIPNGTSSTVKTVSTLGTSADLEPGSISITTAAISVSEGTAFGVEITRAGAGVSSSGANAQWQFSGFSEGTPSPANNTLSWAAGENGPKSISTTAGTVAQNRTGIFRIVAVDAPGSSIQPTLGTSQIAVTVVDTGVSTAIKFNPGHYMSPDFGKRPPDSRYAEFAAMNSSARRIEGFLLSVYWGELNTGNGQYDWTILDHAIAMAELYDLRVILRIEDRSFGTFNQDLVVPADMSGNALYGGGYWQKQNSSGTGGGTGRIARYWLTSVMDRWMVFMAALAARYDNHPRLEMLRGGETAPHLDVKPPDYSEDLNYAAMQRLIVETPQYFRRTIFCLGTNFGVSRSRMEALMALAFANRSGMGGPDSLPASTRFNTTDGSYSDHALVGDKAASAQPFWPGGGGTDYRGQIFYCNEIQGVSMGGEEGGWDAATHYDWMLNGLAQSHMIWFYKTFNYPHSARDLYWLNTSSAAIADSTKFTTDIKTFLSSSRPLVLTPPAYFPSVITGGT